MDRDVAKKKGWDRLFEAASGWDYDEVHSHAEISAIVGVPYGIRKYYAMVGSCNRDLTTIGKRLIVVPSVGYRVVNPDEYTDVALRKIRNASRNMNEADFVASNAPESEMSPEGLQRHRAFSDRLRSFKAMMNKGRREILTVARIKPTIEMRRPKE